jgi:hypothetical protein
MPGQPLRRGRTTPPLQQTSTLPHHDPSTTGNSEGPSSGNQERLAQVKRHTHTPSFVVDIDVNIGTDGADPYVSPHRSCQPNQAMVGSEQAACQSKTHRGRSGGDCSEDQEHDSCLYQNRLERLHAGQDESGHRSG